MNTRYEKNESQENYLEAILRILAEKGYCRSVDVADRLMVAKPSVSTAMRKLLEKELIVMDSSKFIRLTEAVVDIDRVHLFFSEGSGTQRKKGKGVTASGEGNKDSAAPADEIIDFLRECPFC